MPEQLPGVEQWEAVAPHAPAIAVGEVLRHPLHGEVAVTAVDLSGAYPVYHVRVVGGQLDFRTNAAFLS